MSAIDNLFESYFVKDKNIRDKETWHAARAELDALRESEKNWQAQAEMERANAAEQRERSEKLRATVDEQARKISWLTTDVGESGIAAINRLIAVCERGEIGQQYAPDLGIARDEIVRQTRRLEELCSRIAELEAVLNEYLSLPVGRLGYSSYPVEPIHIKAREVLKNISAANATAEQTTAEPKWYE